MHNRTHIPKPWKTLKMEAKTKNNADSMELCISLLQSGAQCNSNSIRLSHFQCSQHTMMIDHQTPNWNPMCPFFKLYPNNAVISS